MFKTGYKFLAALLVAILLAVPAYAQIAPRPESKAIHLGGDEDQGIIKNIRITGTQRVEPTTILSYMSLQAGDPFDTDKLNQSVKKLFATGLFADVSVNRLGDVLEISVKENPVINKIAFEGNDRIKDEDLMNEIQLRERMVYTVSRVQSDNNRILQLYKRSGRYGISVEPKIIERPQNRVDLVFEINEGAKTEIRRISFVGNKNFSDSSLRSVINTKESAWYRFLMGGDTYDPDRLTFDRELLRQFYLKNGYADFKVNSAVAELSPDGKEFYVTFTVEEGQQYEVASVKVNTAIPDLNVAQVQKDIEIEAGDTYNASLVDKTVEYLTEQAGTYGYAFVDVEPTVNRNPQAKTIDLTFNINEGPKVYVERINIMGNVRTLDRVIRREFRLVEGDAFNTAKLRRSRERLNSLGYFETVDVSPHQGSTPDRVVIDVNVVEKSTGDISFGAGYSTTESILGDIRLRERNFLGRGQDVRIGLTMSGKRQEYDLSFTEPYFLGRNLRAGFDLFKTTREFSRNSSFDEERTGGTLRIGYDVNEHLRNDFNYTYKVIDIANVDADASRFVRDQEGSTATSSIGYTVSYDRRDNAQEPGHGYIIRFGNDFAGLGGDSTFIRTQATAAHYWTLGEDLVFTLSAEVGHIAGIGEDVRIADRYFVGGNNMHGFEMGGMGARDTNADDPLGANFYSIGSAELAFPLGLPNDYGITGRLFTDVGTAFDVDDDGPEVADEASIRAAIGAGLAWRSPFGPIRVDVSQAVAKEDFDKTELFRINFGTRF